MFEPLLNFGFIAVARQHSELIEFVNQGKLAGRVTLKQQTGGDAPPVHPDLKFEPDNFVIGAE